MKIRTTKKAIRVAYSNIICLSYCSLRALDYLDADYYCVRSEGWALQWNRGIFWYSGRGKV